MADIQLPTGKKFINRTGMVYGRLTVIAYDGIKGMTFMWRCRCECGTEVSVQSSNLVSGGTKSCGCHRKQRMKSFNTTHGRSYTSEWTSWQSMLGRCYTPENASFKAYGAAGITVCDRWIGSFEAFIADMGEKPTRSHTIDRIDGAKGYEPSNCRWATKSEQAKNRKPRKTHFRVDLTGLRFGRLLVKSFAGHKKWLCRCDCGSDHTAAARNLRSGGVQSCGCLRRELAPTRRRKRDQSSTL